MKMAGLFVFVIATLSFSARVYAFSGTFHFAANDGDSKFATRIIRDAPAQVEVHGIAISVIVKTTKGEETLQGIAEVTSIDCKNDAVFKLPSKDGSEVFIVTLTLPDSDDRTCELFTPSTNRLLSISSFDLERQNDRLHPRGMGMTNFESEAKIVK